VQLESREGPSDSKQWTLYFSDELILSQRQQDDA